MGLISTTVLQELQDAILKDGLQLFKNAGLLDIAFIGLAYITAKYVNSINTLKTANYNSDFLNLGIVFGSVSSIVLSNKGTFLQNIFNNTTINYSLQQYLLKQAVDFTVVNLSKSLISKGVNINVSHAHEKIAKWFTEEFKLPEYRKNLKNVKISVDYIKYFLIGFIAGFVGFFAVLYFIVKKRRINYTLGDYLSDIQQYLFKYIVTDTIATFIISYFIFKNTNKSININLPSLNHTFLKNLSTNSNKKRTQYKLTAPLTETEKILLEKILSVRDTLQKILKKHGISSKFNIIGEPAPEDNLYITYNKNNQKYDIIFKIKVDHSIWQFITNEEIIAVILHELGHYLGKHLTFDKFLYAIIVASFDMTSISYISNVTKAYFKALQKYIMLSIYRFEEMQADKFVIDSGYGKALANALSKIHLMYGGVLTEEEEENSTIHGATNLRIQAIQDLLKVK